MGGIRFDLFAKLIDHDVQVLHLVTIIWPPNSLEDFLMRDCDVWNRNQIVKNLKLLRSKANIAPLNQQMTAEQIHFDAIKRNNRWAFARR